jgi:RNA polymerase sigma-70 factor (ECF subfamily)
MSRFSDLFAQHASELRAYLRSRRYGAQEAEDIVQEGFLRLIQSSVVEAPHNPRAWLYRTCTNLAADAYDHKRVRERVISDRGNFDAVDERNNPARHFDASQTLEQVWEALLALPEPCRHAFLLNRLDGMSQRAIALHLGVSEKTVERHVLRALAACRAALEASEPK